MRRTLIAITIALAFTAPAATASASQTAFSSCHARAPITVLDHNGYTTCAMAKKLTSAWTRKGQCHVGDEVGAPQRRSCTVLTYRCSASVADDVPVKVHGIWTDAIGADVTCKRGRAVIEWEQVF